MSGSTSDASLLAAAIDAQHPDPYRYVSRDAFLREAARLDALGSNTPRALAVELMRMIALLGPRNGHTAIYPIDDLYPLGLYEFEDGVFVIAADRDLFGTELVAIDGVDIGEILGAVTPLVAYDNEWTIRARRPSFVVHPSVLSGLGLGAADRRAAFRLRRPDATVVDVALDPVGVDVFLTRCGDWFSDRPRPTYLRRRDEWHWVERCASGRAVHVGYNVTRGDIGGFARDVEALAATPDVGLVVLDLRHNGGGDNRTYGPLLGLLERLAQTTRLAVLTSRMTFSAAMQLVVDLEQKTPAVFVGEPTGGSPNSYGDAVPVDLPNSGLNAYVATIAWMTAGESDVRLTREPDIPVTQESRAYFAGDDLPLNTAVTALC
jgi:hypothetical protein